MQHIAQYSCEQPPKSIEKCFAANVRKVKVASRYRAFSSSCDLSVWIVLNFNFGFKVLTGRNKRSEML